MFLLLLVFWSFTCAAQNLNFGKSFINLTKGLNGGTLETGDTLEIRASFVVRSGTYDSCAFYDVIPAGTTFIPGTVRVLTNEGKIYKQFTDAWGDDAGYRSGSNIRINLGYTNTNRATAFRRGRVASSHRPTFGGSCIMIASYRVQITAATYSTISTGGGSFTYRSTSGGGVQTFVLPSNIMMVYPNYGICPNAIGANSLGTEFNGTFGTGVTQNRGSSANVPAGYTYATFASNAPQDYFYGIANNTSNGANFTTSNSWPKPDNSSPTHRVFTVWDIIGDHTGAIDPYAGNSPGDNSSTKGYMLIVNAAYRIDSAFQQTISGLCPNTYYEISCWMRNICSRCGSDSTGRGASNFGYIPTDVGDSSGVCPNLTFEIDGIDYYTTGNLKYTGQWVKKGFTFLTGPSQTSFTLKFFNNAPGGGGNDWALDDISVATCSPNLTFTPSNNPVFCRDNVVEMGSNIRSFFNNYTYFQWQKSTDNGVSWNNTGTSGTGVPAWNGSSWEFDVSFPQFVGNAADSGTKYRVVVATSAANLSDPDCSFSESASVLTLNVIDCSPTLSTHFISFHGKTENGSAMLNWTTNEEKESLLFLVERSTNGTDFFVIDSISNQKNYSNALNNYTWSEGNAGTRAFYRVKMVSANHSSKYSKTIVLENSLASFSVGTVVNPFRSALVVDVTAEAAGAIHIELIDLNGAIVRKQRFSVTNGLNKLNIGNTESLPASVYTLRIKAGANYFIKKVMKQ
jgi:hypothetical protein